jgi:hypothetical protein
MLCDTVGGATLYNVMAAFTGQRPFLAFAVAPGAAACRTLGATLANIE